MYETFDHTADIGLRIEGADFADLLAEAGRGLFSVIAGDLAQVRETTRESIRVGGADRPYLLLDWLGELLFAFETRRMLFRRFDVRLDPGGVNGIAFGEPFDPSRHRLHHEVKAVTYHELSVRETANGVEASIVLDI